MIAIDRKAPKALHRQIYDAYRTAIVDGRLRPGQRIPSTRMLASEIGVSRFPVLNAYAQLLAEGYFESRMGAGTIVSSLLPDVLTSSTPPGPQTPVRTRSRGLRSAHSLSSGLISGPRPVSHGSTIAPRFYRAPWLLGFGAFSVGQVAFDQFPVRVWTNLVGRHCRRLDQRSKRGEGCSFAEW